ncbi:hypothetical protein PhaeoP18_01806 [Phaeobacter piscinae]|uniref:Uncharacterized protein n=1 Tax=Phaeobacter piscinae TaxID=1580596 RepID=A0AAN1GRP7_9RHOB|nr:hypothetical protein PhaeoP13_01829 [Phaeobacter piscinae]AUR36075.1 hypothetical protein PhaeoP18_01806 [Phaeobacter piscinae]
MGKIELVVTRCENEKEGLLFMGTEQAKSKQPRTCYRLVSTSKIGHNCYKDVTSG